jgi:hypothetical protein
VNLVCYWRKKSSVKEGAGCKTCLTNTLTNTWQILWNGPVFDEWNSNIILSKWRLLSKFTMLCLFCFYEICVKRSKKYKKVESMEQIHLFMVDFVVTSQKYCNFWRLLRQIIVLWHSTFLDKFGIKLNFLCSENFKEIQLETSKITISQLSEIANRFCFRTWVSNDQT